MQSISLPIGNVVLDTKKLFLIAGPCVLEHSHIGYDIASALKEITHKLAIPFVFKASYTKANRTSKDGYRGVGLEEGLEQLAKIKHELQIPVLSDIHCTTEITQAASVLDILQIPAFLCRQTPLVLAASETQHAVNIKKGQFMAPWDMKHVIEKVHTTNNHQILITERGFSFGYNNLVVDMRSFPILTQMDCLVVFDGTHSTQLPGALTGETGGQREMTPTLVRAAVAAGCHGLFLEVHPSPLESPSDRHSIFPLADLPQLLEDALAIYQILKK